MVFKRPAAAMRIAAAAEEPVEKVQAEADAAVLKRPAAKKAREQEEEPKVEEAPVAVAEEVPVVLKRPAAKQAEEAPAAKEEKKEEPPAVVEEDPEVAIQRVEGETRAARSKELKATPVDDLKKLVGDQGLELGNKVDMVERLVAHEAAGRAAERARQANIRKAVVDKKDSLEAMAIPDLRDLCAEEGIKGRLTKPAFIEALVKLWLADNGVDKALAKIKYDAREQELAAKDVKGLEKLCATVGIDPFVKEVMVDRIVKRENAAGRFSRPALDIRESKQAPAPAAPAGDMVAALLASEANRKKELELKKQADEAAAKKKADLESKSVADLKKLLSSKGRDVPGRKDELVDALLQVGVEEEAASKRRDELKATEPAELKKMLQSKALEVSSKRDEMVETYLAYEAKICKDAVAYSVKVDAILAEKKTELECKTQADLKEMCASKELAQGANKQVCLDRLLEDLKTNGEVDQILAKQARSARREELQAMGKEVLLKLCASLEIDPLVKEVMVERILAHEEESGSVVEEPSAKKARKTK